MNSKIISQKKMISLAKIFKSKKEEVVLVSGSFDIVHARHINFLEKSKKNGKHLFVLINSDESIKKYKGPNRPIINEALRAKLIASIYCVDYVCLFDEINPKKIISQIKPNIYCNGPDWGNNCIEKETVEQFGGKVKVIRGIKKDISTSLIINNILKKYQQPQIKAIFIDRDGTINDNKDGYVHRVEDFSYLPGVISALKKISKTEYKIIIVSNQSGIGRGYYTEKEFFKFKKFILSDLSNRNIRIDEFYYCPHLASDNCNCRKPKIGMFLKAVSDFGISLNDSWMIGDNDDDISAGREANIKTIKIGKVKSRSKVQANFQVSSLLEAVNLILDK